MRPPIKSKQEMYALLAKGSLGNTNPQWNNLDEWVASKEGDRVPLWGVRSLIAGGPCRLDCPSAEVLETAKRFNCPVNLSPMVDEWLTFRCEVFRDVVGLRVFGVEGRKDLKWRQAFSKCGREWFGLTAAMLLRKHLNPNSMGDLEMLLELYPDHVVELTALDHCYGTLPHRNAVVWEVRCTDGSYEGW